MKLINAWIERTDQRLKLMGRMAQKLEVDSAEVFGGMMGVRFRSMAARCRACRHVQLCQRWLDGEEVGRGPEGFCANAETFEAYRPPRRND